MAVVHDYDEDDEEPESEEREDDPYALDIAPEPIAATKLAERRETRIKREEARRAVAPAKRGKQPALTSPRAKYQLPSLGLLTEAPRVKDTQALSDEALEENARMLEAVLADFGVKGRIRRRASRPGGDALRIEPAGGREVLARDLALRRRRAVHVGGGGAHRHDPPGRNVIGIELPNSKPRDGLSARDAGQRRIREGARGR